MAALTQAIRFCTSEDGLRLAYATTGQGPALVRAAHFLTHLEFDLQSPVWLPWLVALSRGHRLLRYDGRGCGLSDTAPAPLSLEAWVADLEAVVDAAGQQRFALLGCSQGAAVSVAYAVRHPERVSGLALLELLARGLDNLQIAAHLGLTEKTVRNKVSAVFDKLEVATRAQAIVRAREAGFGQAPRPL